MGLFSFFSGKTPEAIEKKGDQLFGRRAFGPGKLEYEKAFARSRVSPSKDPDFPARIEKKIADSKHCLALEHVERAELLQDADCQADAAERLDLAATLTTDRALLDRIEVMKSQKQTSNPNLNRNNYAGGKKLHKTSKRALDEPSESEQGVQYDGSTLDRLDLNGPEWKESDLDRSESDDLDMDEIEVFTALVNVLPPEEQEAYPLYGSRFIRGFLAMNQGDFHGASTFFKTALEENDNQTSYIHLELATCLVNLNDGAGAKDLAIKFLDTFSTSFRGWQILGEALWSLEQFDEALDRFASSPASLTRKTPMEILRGETLVLSGRVDEARALYQGLVNAGNRDEAVLRHLAMACERLGENNAANQIYLELINHCSSCGARPDDTLKLRFAETSMALGQISHKLLDIYLDLAVKDADNKAVYFKRVSEIYASLGDENQARRFSEFSLEKEVEN